MDGSSIVARPGSPSGNINLASAVTTKVNAKSLVVNGLLVSPTLIRSVNPQADLHLQAPEGMSVILGDLVRMEDLIFDGNTLSSAVSNGNVSFSTERGKIVVSGDMHVDDLTLSGSTVAARSGQNLALSAPAGSHVVVGSSGLRVGDLTVGE